MYESNPRNSDFDYLPFDGYQGLIYAWMIYHVHDDIVFRLNNGLIFDIYKNQM